MEKYEYVTNKALNCKNEIFNCRKNEKSNIIISQFLEKNEYKYINQIKAICLTSIDREVFNGQKFIEDLQADK